jgi:hypothetical protein
MSIDLRKKKDLAVITGAGISTNPWIAHVKQVAKDNNISYWEAIKKPSTKASYKKISGGRLKPFRIAKALASPFSIMGKNPFELGFKAGYDTIGPAIIGRK